MDKKKKNIRVPVKTLNIKKINVKIGGKSLITHPFSEKAKRQMREKQAGPTKKIGKRDARKPKEEFEHALHILKPGKFEYVENGEDCGLGEVKFSGKAGFPAVGFKKAIVGSARYVDSLPMTVLRGCLFVKGDEETINDLVEISYKKLIMREDAVTVGNGSQDLRYRPEFRDWSAELLVEYNADVMSVEQITNLINLAGFSAGIGEMRPERTGGNYGQWFLMN